jgi:hypothetical protein
MNTTTEIRLGGRTSVSVGVVLLSVAALTLAAACGEPLETEAQESLAQQEAPMTLLSGCTTGNCSDPNNTFGIYAATNMGYCITLGSFRFCPEHFVTFSRGEVYLRGRKVASTGAWPSSPEYLSLKVQGSFLRTTTPLQVDSITTDAAGGLVVEVISGGTLRTLSGSSLQNLQLTVTWDTTPIHLRFGSITAEAQGDKVFWTYNVTYQIPSVSDAWRFTCSDGSGAAAFLKNRVVHGLTAGMQTVWGDVPVVTMACVSGAIGGCMAWGYRPWEASAATQQEADHLFGTCLQAKRAAYFVQSGDYKSYTVLGTPLSIVDVKGIMSTSGMPGVEALWTPNGATCFSPEYRRAAVGTSTLPPLPGTLSVPACTPDVHAAAVAGTLQSEGLINATTPLATGPAS